MCPYDNGFSVLVDEYSLDEPENYPHVVLDDPLHPPLFSRL